MYIKTFDLKYLLSTILLFAIIIQSLGSMVVIAAFELNRDYIAKNLCVNRSKPKMHCNGKCHMHKMLQKEESQSSGPSTPVKEKSEVVQYFNNDQQLALISFDTFYQKIIPYSDTQVTGFYHSVFHPPSC